MKKTMLVFLALVLHIVTNAGTTFQVTLKSNPTTGYSWRLGAKPDKRLVTLQGSKFIAPQTKLVGAGGTEIWTFKALKRGKTKLSLEYARPWEKNIKPVETRLYEVVIK